MITRLAGPGDAERLARLHARAFDKSWNAEEFGAWLAKKGAFAGLAQRNGRVVSLGVVLAAGNDAELLTLASHPHRRRKGAARAVLEELDAEAARRGLERWVLEVACNNVPAMRLYQSLNFVEIGVRKGYYAAGQDRFDGFVLARPIGLAGRQGSH